MLFLVKSIFNHIFLNIFFNIWIYFLYFKEKLEEIFLNKENLIFHDDELKLDRTWFSKNQKIENYKLIKEIPPEMIKIKKFDIENCGYLVYKREN